MTRICVFAGSSAGARPEYAATARELGQALARRRMGLVYGGASVGLMGILADAVMEGGGEAIGVIPGALVAREIAHNGLTDLRVVASMHERKAMMAGLADGFIALPGGLGTLEELFEMLTWSQLGLHRKPCGILNVQGYYDGLIALLEHSTGEGFIRRDARMSFSVALAPEDLLDQLTVGTGSLSSDTVSIVARA